MRRSMHGWRRCSTSWTSVRLTLSAVATASSTVVRQSCQISVLFGGSPLSECDRLSGTQSRSCAVSLCSPPDPRCCLGQHSRRAIRMSPSGSPFFCCCSSPVSPHLCSNAQVVTRLAGLTQGADSSLLCHIGDERAALKKPSGGQPKATGGGRRNLVEQQPVVGAEGPMEPHRVIDGGGLHV